ncbi:hypothetical protein [Noviherbaspirillum aerium]|uniref:hypothetical protein n=1 Tax=Noviherbaspirillum aerium TaxID=2588497 RepID=UPI00124ED7E8|nr:hypothetical protein [Noviherbaspirillum aerium]
MPLRRGTAQKILSEPEFKLVDESFTPAVSALSEKALSQRIERSRKLRDKYQALAERQQAKIGTATSKGGKAGGQAAAKSQLKDTLYKHRMLSETLARFEKTSNANAKGSADMGKVAAVKKTSTKKAVKAPAGKAAKSTRSGVRAASTKPVTKPSAGVTNRAAKKSKETLSQGTAAKKVATKKPAAKKAAPVKAVPKKAPRTRANKSSTAQRRHATTS